jgi:nitroimidazol reductase NimA-like FMN-containing flavoprotein (pyridoxamine 5'-phosphate oxidase superfamily)
MPNPRLFLRDIERSECEELLASARLGRLGVVVNGRPEIFPVNYHVRHEVVFASTGGTKLHAGLEWPWVAFEVDEARPDDTGGWSVLVVGRAEELTDHAEIERVKALGAPLWDAGAPTHWVRVIPERVSGRRVTR